MSDLMTQLQNLTPLSTVVRLVMAMLLGGMIGLERETKNRPAGFRTYMLVCMGAAQAMMLGLYEINMLMTAYPDLGLKTDVFRFGAQVVNGIGFLAAGTIIVTGQERVQGMTTAAGLWASACLGLAAGAGFYPCVLFGMLLILLCTRGLDRLEDWGITKSAHMNIQITFHEMRDIVTITSWMKENNIKIEEIEILEKSAEMGAKRSGAIFFVILPKGSRREKLLSALSDLECVRMVDEI